MRSVLRRISARINKVIRRTTPLEQENEKPAKCKHEWEEIGKDASAAADFQAVFHTTHLKCKLCGKTGIIQKTDYKFH
jgi:hypothetical protein